MPPCSSSAHNMYVWQLEFLPHCAYPSMTASVLYWFEGYKHIILKIRNPQVIRIGCNFRWHNSWKSAFRYVLSPFMLFLKKYGISNVKIGNVLKLKFLRYTGWLKSYPYNGSFVFRTSEILETNINIIIT